MVPWRARLPRTTEWPKPPKSATGFPLDPAPNHDGDTVLLDVDRYNDDSTQWSVRLLAVFCPEISPLQPGGVECRTELWRLLQVYDDGSRWPFWVDTMPATATTDTSKLLKTYDRYVCLVSNRARTRSLNHDISEYAAANGWTGGRGT